MLAWLGAATLLALLVALLIRRRSYESGSDNGPSATRTKLNEYLCLPCVDADFQSMLPLPHTHTHVVNTHSATTLLPVRRRVVGAGRRHRPPQRWRAPLHLSKPEEGFGPGDGV